jgi:methylenetetrahydrofolate dehydrogenase (NADP+)/methenyltetrahydrofolate cyclohydrolase
MTRLLDGKQCASAWQQEMAADVRRIVDAAGRPPGLGVVLVGDRPDSHVYVLRKREACESIGVVSKVKYLEETCSQTNVRHAVQAMCKDGSIDGVLVQLPLPRHIDEEDVIEHFDPGKDVDGFHPLNVGRTLMRGRTARFVPCTAMGCIELLKRSGIELKQKSVVIVGDSNIVGMPLAMLFRDEGTSSVTVIHRSARGVGRGMHAVIVMIATVGAGRCRTRRAPGRGAGRMGQGTHGGKDDEDARCGVIGVDEAEDPLIRTKSRTTAIST